jgi:hypothetical protein
MVDFVHVIDEMGRNTLEDFRQAMKVGTYILICDFEQLLFHGHPLAKFDQRISASMCLTDWFVFRIAGLSKNLCGEILCERPDNI